MAHITLRMFLRFMFICALVSGCHGPLVFDSEVIFKGYVYAGHRGQDSEGNSIIINDGPVAGATIAAAGRPAITKSSSDGSYYLSVRAVRTFTAPDTDIYILEASTTAGLTEQISVMGKPGETVNVRSFVLMGHSEAP